MRSQQSVDKAPPSPPLPTIFLHSSLKQVEWRRKVTVIYEFSLQQTLSAGNREQWGEQHQSHLLLAWPNTPGEPLACVCVCIISVLLCVCLHLEEEAEDIGKSFSFKKEELSLLTAEENCILAEVVLFDSDVPH